MRIILLPFRNFELLLLIEYWSIRQQGARSDRVGGGQPGIGWSSTETGGH